MSSLNADNIYCQHICLDNFLDNSIFESFVAFFRFQHLFICNQPTRPSTLRFHTAKGGFEGDSYKSQLQQH
jgi:hypothetical protein